MAFVILLQLSLSVFKNEEIVSVPAFCQVAGKSVLPFLHNFDVEVSVISVQNHNFVRFLNYLRLARWNTLSIVFSPTPVGLFAFLMSHTVDVLVLMQFFSFALPLN